MGRGSEGRTLHWRRRPGLFALLLGLLGLGAALAGVLVGPTPPLRKITLTAGALDSTRAIVARALDRSLAAHGFDVELVGAESSEDEVQRVERGDVDFALVSGAYRLERYPHLRLVAPLYVEAVHLLVKQELAGSVGRALTGLHGRTVDIGPHGSTSAGLAVAILEFAGVRRATEDAPDGYQARSLSFAELETRVRAGDRAAMPDAVMHLATLPAKLAQAMIHGAGYALVPLPFAEPLKLRVLLGGAIERGPAADIDITHITDAVIPAYTYGLEPPTPARPLPTVGARLLLVANQAVPDEAVERVVEAMFEARFAQLTSPPLDGSLLRLPATLPRHPGTIDYLRRDAPFVTDDAVDRLNNSLGILGALAGAAWFLWQWWRQRLQGQRDETFGTYMLRVADVERRIATLELSATLELEPLAELQRELLELKREALEHFAAGDLGDQSALADLLNPINSARDHIGNLILHIRDSIEEQAESEGRTATEVWEEAIEKPEE